MRVIDREAEVQRTARAVTRPWTTIRIAALACIAWLAFPFAAIAQQTTVSAPFLDSDGSFTAQIDQLCTLYQQLPADVGSCAETSSLALPPVSGDPALTSCFRSAGSGRIDDIMYAIPPTVPLPGVPSGTALLREAWTLYPIANGCTSTVYVSVLLNGTWSASLFNVQGGQGVPAGASANLGVLFYTTVSGAAPVPATGVLVCSTPTQSGQGSCSSAPSVPVCTLSPSAASPIVNTNVTLTANCTNSPTSYKWTGCNSTGATCIASASTPGAASYSVVATNAGGDSAPASVTVNWQAALPSAPVCTLGASDPAPTVSTDVTLSATCTNNPTRYTWTHCASTGPTCVATASTPGSVTYSVVATNAGGDSGPASVSVAWQAVATPPPTCTYSLSGTNVTFGGNATTSSVVVSAPAGCTWSAASNASWLTITSGASGTGSGSVVFAVAANAGASRTGTITIAGDTFTATQVQFLLGAADFLPVGARPRQVGATDLNGDGFPDLVAIDFDSNDVTVLLNDGRGHFTAKSYPTGVQPGRFRFLDVDTDGRNDIVVLNEGSNTVTILRNDGKGAFSTLYTLPVGNTPQRVWTFKAAAVGGAQDNYSRIVVSNGGDNTLTYFALDASGKIVSQPSTLPVGRRPIGIANLDLEGDGLGYDSIAVVNGDDATVSLVERGSSQGELTRVLASYPVGAAPTNVSVGDLNGDGKPDVIVTNQGGNSISVLLGTGTATLTAATTYPTGATPIATVLADLNGDGKLDIVVPNNGENTVSVLLNNGDGTFAAAKNYLTDNGPTSPIVVDIDGDGISDLVVPNASGSVTILKGAGDGTFVPLANTVVPISAGVSNAITTRGSGQVSDFDRDGTPDIVVALPNANALALVRNPNGSRFATVVEYVRLAADGSARYFVTPIAAEIDALDTGAIPGWRRTGASFRAFLSAAQQGVVPVCRLYFPSTGVHFYSTSASECNATAQQFPGTLESMSAFFAASPSSSGTCPVLTNPTTPTTPVYRLYDGQADSDRRFVTSAAARDAMLAQGSVLEGIGSPPVYMCAP